MGHRSARIAVRLPSDLRKRLDAAARSREVTCSDLVKLALVRLLDDLEELRALLARRGEGT